jgi:uncharacterized protein YjcR
MPRARSPNRDRSFEIWKDSGGKIPLKEIADQLGISDTQVRKWKNQDHWKESLNGNVTNKLNGNVNKRGAPKKNKNSVGHGAPKRNNNAVTTGAYETIWFDTLTEEEKALYETINTDTLTATEHELKFSTIRERRMMERVRRLMDGPAEKERKVLHELQIQKKPTEVYDEKTGRMKLVVVPESKMVVTEIRETEFRTIDDIVKLEEALTHVQDRKTRQLALKHTIELANKENGDDTDEPPTFIDNIGSDHNG